MCFSLDFWFKVCVAIILVIGLWSIIKLFLPYLESKLPAIVVQIINIIIWVGIALLCLVVIFFFLSCIWGLVSGMFGGLPHSFQRSGLETFYAAATAGSSTYPAGTKYLSRMLSHATAADSSAGL